ncbi:WYL domain-containing protein [Treponema socranskii]|uniref:WYL domain-containing protein n=1 Tax=Treponema socranskii TaxID=53419 RepID=UPI003D6DF84D
MTQRVSFSYGYYSGYIWLFSISIYRLFFAATLLCTFVSGYDLNKKAVRLFALNRMKDFIVTNEHFELADDFEFSSYCGGGKFGAFMSEDSVDFIIDFYGDARPYVKERLWADNQKLTDFEDEEKIRIEFSLTQVLKVMG